MEQKQPAQNTPVSLQELSSAPSRHRARLYFFVLIVGSLVLIITAAIISLFFDYNPVNSSLVVTPKTTVSPSADPLVSVVPSVSDASVSKGAPIPLVSDPKRGATAPRVVIIEFGDFQCENCAAMKSTMEQIMTEYPGVVQHVWKDFPLTQIHQYAQTASLAARCAAEQDRFWEYHDLLLTKQDSFITAPWSTLAQEAELDVNAFTSCLSSAQTERLVVQSYFIGQAVGVSEAPTYYVNTRRLNGPQSYETLKSVIEEELKQ